MIVSSGYNIAGPEVEEALLAHPAVSECGVVGLPDELRGQVVTAFVVLAPGSSATTSWWRSSRTWSRSASRPTSTRAGSRS